MSSIDLDNPPAEAEAYARMLAKSLVENRELKREIENLRQARIENRALRLAIEKLQNLLDQLRMSIFQTSAEIAKTQGVLGLAIVDQLLGHGGVTQWQAWMEKMGMEKK